MTKKKQRPERQYRLLCLAMPDPGDPAEEVSVSVRADLKDIRQAVTDTVALGDEEAEIELPVTLTIRRVRRDLLRELRRTTKR